MSTDKPLDPDIAAQLVDRDPKWNAMVQEFSRIHLKGRRQREYLSTVSRLYDGNPDIKWLVARVRVALDAADFLDSYSDESELARLYPTMVQTMRGYADGLRGEA